jgi:hypothetical protein
MQQWEYAILDCQLTTGKLLPESYWAPWMFKGEVLPDWQNIRFTGFINGLGLQGWELVVFSHSSETREYWVFKRAV